jgi:hypothetical protein
MNNMTQRTQGTYLEGSEDLYLIAPLRILEEDLEESLEKEKLGQKSITEAAVNSPNRWRTVAK